MLTCNWRWWWTAKCPINVNLFIITFNFTHFRIAEVCCCFCFLLLSHHMCWPHSHRHFSCPARPSIPHCWPHPGLILPQEVHRRWLQIVGGLLSEGDTALLLSHFGGVRQWLSWFNIPRTPPTNYYGPYWQKCWLSHRLRLSEHLPQRADHHYIPPPILLCGLSDIVDFDQNCLRQGRR